MSNSRELDHDVVVPRWLTGPLASISLASLPISSVKSASYNTYNLLYLQPSRKEISTPPVRRVGMQVTTETDLHRLVLAYPGTGMSNKKFKPAVSDIVSAVVPCRRVGKRGVNIEKEIG